MSVPTKPQVPGVMYVIGSFRYGGTERHVLELVRRLDRSKFVPVVGVVDPSGALETAFRESGVPIHVIGTMSLASPKGLRRLRALARFARSNGVRLVHGYNFHGNLYGALASFMAPDLRLVTSERGIVEGLRRRHHWARRFYHRRSRRMLVNSPAVGAYVTSLPTRGNGWLRVIPNGVDTAAFDPQAVIPISRKALGLPAEGPLVGHVGRFRFEKGQTFLLDGLRGVATKRPDACFLLAGGGPDEHDIRAAAACLPLAGRTAVLGYQEDVRPLLRAMDVFVLPSASEGMPNALLEAIAMGLACVATRVGGTAELLDDGRAGRLVDYGDVQALESAILGLLSHPEERARLRNAARDRAVESFSMEAQVTAYESVYAEALDLPVGSQP